MLQRTIKTTICSLYKKIKNHKYEFAILTIIMAGGIFLRTFHFIDWLHFEIDQAYDINTVSPAITKGIANLSLFGPNVGGGDLRLGPAFYYMEYVSALIFGNTPPGHAMAVLLLNIAAIPLFYIFCRKYFSIELALGLDAIFAFSLFNVMYSRFSWSPNVLPFLVVFSFYALLQTFSPGEKHPARWFLTAIAAVTITSQIHFNSFFVIPLIAVLFTAFKWPRFPWKVWAVGLAIIFLIYSPMIASDIKTHGQNIRLFKIKFQKTAGVATSRTQSIVNAAEYGAYGSWFIVSADDEVDGLRLKNFGFTCADCKDNLPVKIFALVVFLISSLILFFNVFKEKDKVKRDFSLLMSLWVLVTLYLFYTIAKSYRMYPRFYLIISPLAVILLGMLLQYFKPHLSKLRLSLFSLIIILLVFLNVQKIIPIFNQLANVPNAPVPNVENGDIFPNTNRLTYSEELNLADYIESKYKQNGFPVYLSARPEYTYAYWYLLEQRGIQYFDKFDSKNIYAQGNYFVVKFADERQSIDSEFKIIEKKNLGTLIVYYLEPLPQYIKEQRQSTNNRKIPLEGAVVSKLLTWKKLFQ